MLSKRSLGFFPDFWGCLVKALVWWKLTLYFQGTILETNGLPFSTVEISDYCMTCDMT